MRDGTELAADLYYPEGQPGPFPAVLERTPYNRESSALIRTGTHEYLASRGYLVVVQDVRGRYGSDGIWYPFVDDGWGRLRDGYDTIEWVARHPLCNGRVGTAGGSYAAHTQLLAAATRPPHLLCCFVRQAASDLASQWLYRGGAFEYAFNLDWNLRHALDSLYRQFVRVRETLASKPDMYSQGPLLRHEALADPLAWLRDSLRHPDKDEFYEPFDIESRYDQVQVPVYHVGGWFDLLLGGTLNNFIGLCRRARSTKARRSQRLLIGPWIHGSAFHDPQFARYVGELDFGPEAVVDMNAEMLRWFDHWLLGLDTGLAQTAPVRYFLMGPNRWLEASGWPPPERSTLRFYLHGPARPGNSDGPGRAGRLELTRPNGSARPSRYRYDPRDPVPTIGGHTLYSIGTTRDATGAQVPDFAATAGPRDQRPILNRCLVFNSPPLKQPITVAGSVRAVLYVSSSAPDTDFVVRLCDLFPDGRSLLVADGILRARYRSGRRQARPLVPGKLYRIEVDLWHTAWQFALGHAIQLLITSSCFPRFDCNPNTGGTTANSTKVQVARNAVYHDRTHPSHLILEVMEEQGPA